MRKIGRLRLRRFIKSDQTSRSLAEMTKIAPLPTHPRRCVFRPRKLKNQPPRPRTMLQRRTLTLQLAVMERMQLIPFNPSADLVFIDISMPE